MENRNWSIAGQPVASVMPPYKCGWIVSAPDACEGCELNPRNRPAPSPPLQHLFYLESLQAAGITFALSDLKPWEVRLLLMGKAERNRAQIEQMKKK